MNRVVGARLSIVTPKAQTTRERVLGILTVPQGQIVFCDTPGIHKAKDGGINAYMMQEVRDGLEGVDAVWYIVDPASATKFEQPVLETLAKALGASPDKEPSEKPSIFVLFNKSDLKHEKFSAPAVEMFMGELTKAAAALGLRFTGDPVRISARDGKGVDELLKATWATLSHGPFLYPDEEQLSDRPTRFFVGEMIREQLFLTLGEEVPYSCAVEIEKFEENKKPPRIEAVIHVERDSQKGMVVGKGGAKIKEIGQGAREAIEEFLGVQVFLGLRVKVLKEWSRDAEALKRLGYILPNALKAQAKKRSATPNSKVGSKSKAGAKSSSKPSARSQS